MKLWSHDSIKLQNYKLARNLWRLWWYEAMELWFYETVMIWNHKAMIKWKLQCSYDDMKLWSYHSVTAMIQGKPQHHDATVMASNYKPMIQWKSWWHDATKTLLREICEAKKQWNCEPAKWCCNEKYETVERCKCGLQNETTKAMIAQKLKRCGAVKLQTERLWNCVSVKPLNCRWCPDSFVQQRFWSFHQFPVSLQLWHTPWIWIKGLLFQVHASTKMMQSTVWAVAQRSKKKGVFCTSRDRCWSWWDINSTIASHLGWLSSAWQQWWDTLDFWFLSSFIWVGWVHSCTEMMLSPFWIIAQRSSQNGSFLDFSWQLKVLVSPQLHGGSNEKLWIRLCVWMGPFVSWNDVVAILDRDTENPQKPVVFGLLLIASSLSLPPISWWQSQHTLNFALGSSSGLVGFICARKWHCCHFGSLNREPVEIARFQTFWGQSSKVCTDSCCLANLWLSFDAFSRSPFCRRTSPFLKHDLFWLRANVGLVFVLLWWSLCLQGIDPRPVFNNNGETSTVWCASPPFVIQASANHALFNVIIQWLLTRRKVHLLCRPSTAAHHYILQCCHAHFSCYSRNRNSVPDFYLWFTPRADEEKSPTEVSCPRLLLHLHAF